MQIGDRKKNKRPRDRVKSIVEIIESMGYGAAIHHPDFAEVKGLVYEMIENGNLDVGKLFWKDIRMINCYSVKGGVNAVFNRILISCLFD